MYRCIIVVAILISITVDNQAAILGGRNIGNEYFEADPGIWPSPIWMCSSSVRS